MASSLPKAAGRRGRGGVGGGGPARPPALCLWEEWTQFIQHELKRKVEPEETLLRRVRSGRKIGPELSRVCRGLEPKPPTSCRPTPTFFFSFDFMCTGNQGDESADTFSMGPGDGAAQSHTSLRFTAFEMELESNGLSGEGLDWGNVILSLPVNSVSAISFTPLPLPWGRGQAGHSVSWLDFFFLSRVAKWLWKTAQRGP